MNYIQQSNAKRQRKARFTSQSQTRLSDTFSSLPLINTKKSSITNHESTHEDTFLCRITLVKGANFNDDANDQKFSNLTHIFISFSVTVCLHDYCSSYASKILFFDKCFEWENETRGKRKKSELKINETLD